MRSAATSSVRGLGARAALVALVALASFLPQGLSSAEAVFQGEILAPPLLEEGVPFEATIVRQTAGGTLPLAPGEKVRYGEKDLEVGPGGTVVLPAPEGSGNQFLEEEVSLPSSKARIRLQPRHVEVVRLAKDLAPKILHTSRILRPGGTITALGQRLDRLQPNARLAREGASAVELGRPVFRSSLSVRWNLPANLPRGPWRLEMSDAGGRGYPAPEVARHPTLEVWGPEVNDLSRDGAFYVRSDTDVSVTIAGGLPEIRVRETRLDLAAGRTAEVRYTPLRVGRFRVRVKPESVLDEPPPEDAPGVDANSMSVETRYDGATRTTEVRAPTQLVDVSGRPLAGRFVAVLLSHGGGIEFRRLTTDPRGVATFVATLPGNVAAASVRAHLWAARGTVWRKQGGCKCALVDVKIPREGKDAPSIDYSAGDKKDSIKFGFTVEGKLKATGSGSVTLSMTTEPKLTVYRGDSKDIAKYEKLLDAAHVADGEGKKDLAAQLKKQAQTLADKLEPGTVTLKQGKKQKAAEDEKYPCTADGEEVAWKREPVGEISWEGKDYRIGTAKEPQPRHFFFEVVVTVTCGTDSTVLYVHWRADVGWEDGKVKVSNDSIYAGAD